MHESVRASLSLCLVSCLCAGVGCLPCCIPARDSARCPCVPRELTIKARARLPVAHPLAHHTTRQPHAHGGSSPAPYQGKTGANGMGATPTCARRHQLFPVVCFVRAVWQALVHPLDCENSIPAQGTQPLHCRSRTAVDGKYFASKMFKTGWRSIRVTHTCCMQASAPAPLCNVDWQSFLHADTLGVQAPTLHRRGAGAP